MSRVLSSKQLWFASFFVFFAALATAADWPQWRRPKRDGISQEKGLLKEWPTEGPKLLWEIKDLGDGWSTPAVVSRAILPCALLR
jgi:hypothetical protein